MLIILVDTHAPSILFCPNNLTKEADLQSFGAIVTWEEPIADDISKHVMILLQTHSSGNYFAVGTTIVSYIFRDSSNNMAKCSFSVTIVLGKDAKLHNHCGNYKKGTIKNNHLDFQRILVLLSILMFIYSHIYSQKIQHPRRRFTIALLTSLQ